jgi:uncharacterized protein YbcV (DUF1398 family)
MNPTIQTALEQSARGEISYPTLAQILVNAGIRSYHVDVAAHTATYHGEGEPFTHQGQAIAHPQEPPPLFREDALKAAIIANQRKEIDYEEFLRRIWQSGTTVYDVDLEEKTVTYRGRGGEACVERIPI